MKPEAPIWTKDQLALLADGRLSGDARVVGLLLSLAGEEGLSYDELQELLPDVGRYKLRAAAQKLERCKWADRLIGGRGHSDRFVYIACPPGATYVENRLAIFGILKDRVRNIGNLSAFRVPNISTLSPSSSYTTPPPPPMDARAREWVESSEVLKGCRGSLVDYLTERVEADHQLAYAQTVAGWIEGTDEGAWWTPGGTRLDREARAKIVAGCLNELRQGDEVGQYFKGPPGDARNLRSKIRYRVKSKQGAEQDAARTERTNGRPATRTAGQAGTKQGTGGGREVAVER